MDNPNYVTPEEAKGKMLCPMGMPYADGDCYCAGPKCMAWRWKSSTGRYWIWADDLNKSGPAAHWIPVKEWMQGERRCGEFIEGPTHGYCGMVRS